MPVIDPLLGSDNVNWTDITPKAHAQHPCPNCGYCPTCGRNNGFRQWHPWYPGTAIPHPYIFPTWSGTNTAETPEWLKNATITSSGPMYAA